MKKFLLVANPSSGNGTAPIIANKIKTKLKKLNVDSEIFLSDSIEHYKEFCTTLFSSKDSYSGVVLIGGDGTLSTSIDILMHEGVDLPIAIYPRGTANDFAKALNIPTSISAFSNMLILGEIKQCDIALVNDTTYAINVAGGGYFTHGANSYSRQAKKYFGKITYYTKGAFNVFNMKPQKLKVTIDDETITDEFILYLVVNSCNVGGFQKICKNASIDDGNYDFVGIKKPKVFRLASLFFSIIKGKYERNKDIIYKQGKNFHIEFDGSVNPKFKSSDIDGNVGPLLPLQIQVLQQKIKFIYRQVK